MALNTEQLGSSSLRTHATSSFIRYFLTHHHEVSGGSATSTRRHDGHLTKFSATSVELLVVVRRMSMTKCHHRNKESDQ